MKIEKTLYTGDDGTKLYPFGHPDARQCKFYAGQEISDDEAARFDFSEEDEKTEKEKKLKTQNKMMASPMNKMVVTAKVEEEKEEKE